MASGAGQFKHCEQQDNKQYDSNETPVFIHGNFNCLDSQETCHAVPKLLRKPRLFQVVMPDTPIPFRPDCRQENSEGSKRVGSLRMMMGWIVGKECRAGSFGAIGGAKFVDQKGSIVTLQGSRSCDLIRCRPHA